MDLAVILPTRSQFGYARAAVRSLLEHTPGVALRVALVDDASPDWKKNGRDWPAEVVAYRFAKRDGLTRSWNRGLELARGWRARYTVCTNSDVLFTPGWYDALAGVLGDGSLDLAGPLTNAPGHRHQQQVARYLPDYEPSDQEAALARTARRLRKLGLPPVREGLINGFFLMARTETWWDRPHRSGLVFNPERKLTGNEDELEGRWLKDGRKVGIAMHAFVFHYRGVSRSHGQRGRPGRGWFRPEKGPA